jgi:hypothetical protein
VSRGVVALVFGAFVVACSRFGSEGEATAKDGDAGASPGPSSGVDAAAADGAASADGAAPPDACPDLDETRAFCEAKCGDRLCRSCREIKMRYPPSPSGYYRIAGSDDALDVYCDMETADGGWILVARSDDDHDEPFGWKDATGTVMDDQNAYSLGVSKLTFEPAEMLFGTRKDGKQWDESESVFTLKLSEVDFWTNGLSDTVDTDGTLTTVDGDCVTGSTPGGFHPFIGFIADARDHFYFHDGRERTDRKVGLTAAGWSGVSDTKACAHDGNLDGDGMIFVREAPH